MSYTRIYKIEEELSSIKKITPDDIEDTKFKLLNYLNQNQINKEELKNTKIKYQSQLASPSTLSNNLAICAIVLSVTMGSFSLSTADKGFLAIMYSFLLLSTSGLLFFLLIVNSKTYKKYGTYTIMINLIDELLES
ncbi:hypothetical protein D3C74_140900 [compost metagenome]